MAKTVEVLETIDLLYQAAMEPKLWPDALSAFARAVGGIGTAMIPITPLNTAGLIVSPELAEPNVEYEKEWWRHDTRVLRIFSRRLTNGVCCEAELFTDDELARDPLRQEFLRSYGLGAFAAQLVAPMPDFVVAFSVQRALNRGHFERHELETLGLLGRHAARALLVSSHLAAARKLEHVLAEALARFNCAAFVVDRESNVIFANEASSRLMGDGLCVQQQKLRASCRDDQDVLDRLMNSVLSRSASIKDADPVLLRRPSGRRPLLLQAVPLAADSMDHNLPSGPAALVIVIDPEQDQRHSPVKALRLLGLTRSEARLAALIGAGHTRAEAAEALRISQSTVNDTVKQVYSKLDISRQSELVRLVERLAVLSERSGSCDAQG